MSEQSKKRMFYRAKPSNNRRFTVVGLENEDGSYSIGLSISGDKDSFNKKLGLLIAEGRARKRPISSNVVFNEEGVSKETQFIKMAKDMPNKLPDLFDKNKLGKNNSFRGSFERKK